MKSFDFSKIKPGNTPLISLDGMFGIKTLWMKDEVKNITYTFKDRLAWEMIRPMVEEFQSGKVPSPMTFGSISYGNTAKAMGYYTRMLNEAVGSAVATAVAFVPPSLSQRTFGPNVRGQTVLASKVLEDIGKNCTIVPIDLKKKIYRSPDLEAIARENGLVPGKFVDITEGLDRPAYVNIFIETVEDQLKSAPDYAIVPFGAGILCNEVIDYVNDHKLKTKVIPVSSGDPNTIAIMLYGPIWVDVEALVKQGWGWTRHEDPDKKGRKREQYKVYHVTDDAIREAMDTLKTKGIDAEPSGASGFALIPQLSTIDPNFDVNKHSVLVINTGDGILNYV